VPGKYGSSCQECPSGYKRDDDDLKDKCLKCRVGRYNDQHAQPFCKFCDAGKFQHVNGSSVCQKCPNGSYEDAKGTFDPRCRKCPEGFVPKLQGLEEVPTGCTDPAIKLANQVDGEKIELRRMKDGAFLHVSWRHLEEADQDENANSYRIQLSTTNRFEKEGLLPKTLTFDGCSTTTSSAECNK